MGYPTSVPSFTNKNAGDVLQPAHVNDLQTEITAIESDLLNGFTGKLTANAGFQSSNSTFSVRPVMPPPDAVRVYLDSTSAIGSSQFSTLSFLSQDFITNSSMHSTGTNPERLIPQSTGLYRADAGIQFSPASSGTYRQIGIVDSSGGVVAQQFSAVSTGGAYQTLNAGGIKRFDVLGGYVTCQLQHSTLSTASLSTGAGFSWFSLHKL